MQAFALAALRAAFSGMQKEASLLRDVLEQARMARFATSSTPSKVTVDLARRLGGRPHPLALPKADNKSLVSLLFGPSYVRRGLGKHDIARAVDEAAFSSNSRINRGMNIQGEEAFPYRA